MSSPDYVLALVSDQKGQLALHADAKGLSMLISSLERLKKKAEEGVCDHDHLFTASWTGPVCDVLTEKKGFEEGEIIHHLKIYGWTEEWTRKHGFIE